MSWQTAAESTKARAGNGYENEDENNDATNRDEAHQKKKDDAFWSLRYLHRKVLVQYDWEVTDPVRSPRESVGPKPSYQVHLLVAISVLWYVATKLFNCAEQKLSRDADLLMEASVSKSVPFSFLSVPFE
jgi:hypothetical protein